MSVHPYTELIDKEVEIIGVSDHLATELPPLIEFARSGKLRFPPETLRVVDLDAAQINAALDALQDSIDHVRTVSKWRVLLSPPAFAGLWRASELMNSRNLSEFAKGYAKRGAVKSGQRGGVLRRECSFNVNGGPPVGRALPGIAQGFMTGVSGHDRKFDKLESRGDGMAFHWTLTGTNTGPGGTGKQVRISGYELWKIGDDGLIANRKGISTPRSMNVSLSRRGSRDLPTKRTNEQNEMTSRKFRVNSCVPWPLLGWRKLGGRGCVEQRNGVEECKMRVSKIYLLAPLVQCWLLR